MFTEVEFSPNYCPTTCNYDHEQPSLGLGMRSLVIIGLVYIMYMWRESIMGLIWVIGTFDHMTNLLFSPCIVRACPFLPVSFAISRCPELAKPRCRNGLRMTSSGKLSRCARSCTPPLHWPNHPKLKLIFEGGGASSRYSDMPPSNLDSRPVPFPLLFSTHRDIYIYKWAMCSWHSVAHCGTGGSNYLKSQCAFLCSH